MKDIVKVMVGVLLAVVIVVVGVFMYKEVQHSKDVNDCIEMLELSGYDTDGANTLCRL